MRFWYKSQIPLLFATCLMAACTGLLAPALKAQYCLPTYNSQCTSDDYINTMQFVTINNSNTGCGTPGASNYTNYSASLGTTVTAGATNVITVAPGPTWGQYFIALIDINQDNDFADAGEFFDIGYAAGGQTISANITVPCGAMGGTTRMRVMCRYASTPLTQADICATGLSFGEVEDYNLTIVMPAFTDGGLSGFTAPVTACGMGATNPVTISLYNCGGTTITTAQVCYTFQGGASVCETISLSLAPGNTTTHTFASTVNMATFGNYAFTASIAVPGDAVAGNNNINSYVVTNIPVISTLPYTQTFDSDNGGFTVEGTNPSWAWGAPGGTFISSAASAPNAWVTNLTGAYNTDELSYLISPCFNFSGLTADPFISFSHIYDVQMFSDGGWLEVTTNAGGTWTKLGTSTSGNNWYNEPFDNIWDGSSGAAGQWRTADHRMTGTAGSGNVRFRYVMNSDAFTSYEGFGVDNVRIRDTIFNAGVIEVNSPLNGCALGSTETVSVDIVNYGTHTISNFNVCYSIDGGTSVCEMVTTPIPAGDTLTYTFTTPANLAVQGPHTVGGFSDLNRDSIIDNDTTLINVMNFPIVNVMPHLQTFEAGQADWIADGFNNDWAFGTPNKLVIQGAASGTKAWVTGTTGFFNYSNDQDSWVESPCYDISSLATPWVATRVWWETENSWDAALLEYSTDGGNTWNQIGDYGDPYYWYNDSDYIALTNAGLEGDGWGGTQASQQGSGMYVQTKHEIQMLAGATSVRFRMHFLSDGSVTYDGIAFDNFAIGQPPVVNLGNDTIVCVSHTINSNLPTNGIFTWSNGDTTSSILATATGNYVLTYTDSLGLTGRDTVVVTINPTPAVDLGPDQLVCATTTLCLAVDTVAYTSTTWSNGATTGQICVGTTGTWSVHVTDTVGCTSVDTILTTQVPLPTPNLGPDTALCFGQTICLDPGVNPGSHTYIWSNGASTPTVCTSIIAGYWVSVTDQNGCSKSDSIILTPGPLVPTAGGVIDTSGCPIVQFTTSSSGTINNYGWTFGDGGSSSLQSPSHDYSTAGNGTYTVTHIVDNQCGADTVSLTVTISCIVSIDGGLSSRLTVWPNPNQGRFNLEAVLPGAVPARVEILNLQGQSVYARDFGTASGRFVEEISLDAHASGVYFVRFEVGGEVKMEKVVIE